MRTTIERARGLALTVAGLGLACQDPAPAVDGGASSDGGPSSSDGTTASVDDDTTTTATSSVPDETAEVTGDAGPFTVGGTLEGLQGASVQLRRGDDLLELTANGAFAFDQPLPDGDAYAVEIDVHPSGPDQSCTVEGGEGTIAGADVEDVVVRCVTPIRHVIVVGIDGFGGDWLEPVPTPALDALREESAWTLQMQNALPTSSSTNWMSMIGGSTPQQHGVLSNGWQPGDSSPPPTMFAALRQHAPAARIGVFHDWTAFDRLVEPGVTDHMEDPGDEQDTMDAAIAWIMESAGSPGVAPELTFVHLDHVDHAGHAYGWGSSEYFAAVQQADALVGELRQALDDEGQWPYTALLVSADHGGVGLLHGADTATERSIPFLLHTPQGTVGPLDRDLRIWDIAATVLALLDVPAPAPWVASPVVEGLYGTAWSLPPAPEAAQGVSVVDPFWLYDDTGTGAAASVSLWRPVAPAGHGLLGDVAVMGHAPPAAPAIAIADDPLVAQPPRGFELVWQDTLSGGVNDVSLWNPIPPLGFVCLGAVAVAGYVEPQIDQLRCVHSDLVQLGLSAHTWDDAGSGALWDTSLWSCIAGGAADPAATGLVTGAFVARRHGSDPGVNRCRTLRSELVTLSR